MIVRVVEETLAYPYSALCLFLITKAARTPDPTDEHNLIAIPIVAAIVNDANTSDFIMLFSLRSPETISARIGWLYNHPCHRSTRESRFGSLMSIVMPAGGFWNPVSSE